MEYKILSNRTAILWDEALMRLALVWVVLNMLDFGITGILLSTGCFWELHPIVAALGEPVLIALYKGAFTVGSLGLLVWIGKPPLLKWLNIGMGIIVAWNTLWLVLWLAI